MTIRQLIREEMDAREQTIIGTVVRQRRLIEFDGSVGGSPCWVVDVDIGSSRLVTYVPVKGGSGLRKTYADIGQSVVLRRNANGRFDVVGPGDRAMGIRKTKGYDLSDGSYIQGPDEGFSVRIESYDFYQGPTQFASATEQFTFNQIPAANDEITRPGPGSWTAEGFTNGVWIFVSGTVSNEGAFGPIVASAALTIEFAGDVFVDEGALLCSVGHTSRWMDGVTPYPVRTTRDAQGNIII